MTKARVEIQQPGEGEEWPEIIIAAYEAFVQFAREHDFVIVAAIGINPEFRRLSAQFSSDPNSPYKAEMCEDIGEMFKLMAQRFKQ